MLSELSPQTQQEIRVLRKIKEGKGNYSTPEERDGVMDKLIHHISDVVLSLLLREDEDKQKHFLIER